jgi:hypothetical protein
MNVAVITGDIIHSRKMNPKLWLPLLEKTLSKYGGKGKKWKIYRGDSFQLEIALDKVFEAVFLIKTTLKMQKMLDVRMAVGVGGKNYTGKNITTSNGEAYVYSGQSFDGLKKHTFIIKTACEELNEQLNLILNLAFSIVDKWNANISTTVQTALNNRDLTQSELAELLNKKQVNISRDLKKAHYEEIVKTIYFCTKILKEKCSHSS